MNLIPRSFFFDDFNDILPSRSLNPLKCDIYEKDNNYIIDMDIPGFKKDEVKIEIDNGNLSISASRKQENDEEDKNYIRKERTYQEYKRSFYMGDVDEDNIKAEFKDGVLKLIVPKKEQIETRKTIDIE